VGSSLSIGLPIQGSVVGALNVYGGPANAFDAAAITVAERFASYAAVALANAHLYDSATTLAEQMQQAMRSRAVIEQAKGIIMGERRCSPEEAFALLSKASQDSNLKVREVAEALVAKAVQGGAESVTPRGPARVSVQVPDSHAVGASSPRLRSTLQAARTRSTNGDGSCSVRRPPAESASSRACSSAVTPWAPRKRTSDRSSVISGAGVAQSDPTSSVSRWALLMSISPATAIDLVEPSSRVTRDSRGVAGSIHGRKRRSYGFGRRSGRWPVN
jgi:hypothetical protein